MHALHKKGVAFTFLLELLLLLGFVGLIFLAGAKITNHDSKYLTFDSYNLALFLERASSTEGNFVYKLDFKTFQYSNKTVDLTITKNEVLLDHTGLKNKKYKAEYTIPAISTPLQQQESVDYNNISSIYIYKIRGKISLRETVDEKLELSLRAAQTAQSSEAFSSKGPTKIYYFSETAGSSHPKISYGRISDLCSERKITFSSADLIILQKNNAEAKQNEIKIYSSVSALNFGRSLQSTLLEKIGDQNMTILLIPSNSKTALHRILEVPESCDINSIMNANTIIITTNSILAQTQASVYALQQAGAK